MGPRRSLLALAILAWIAAAPAAEAFTTLDPGGRARLTETTRMQAIRLDIADQLRRLLKAGKESEEVVGEARRCYRLFVLPAPCHPRGRA